MNQQQRRILVFLSLTLLLEFGSFSKLKQIWVLAFTGQPTNNIPGPNDSVHPDQNGNCPVGYLKVGNLCYKVPGVT